MDTTMLVNLAGYGAQLAIVAAVGSLALLVFRIDAPAVRYHYWRALLAACLLLPWIQGRDAAPAALAETATVVAAGAADASSVAAGAAPGAIAPWAAIAAAVLVAGAAIRLLWIGRNLRRLGALRTAGRAVPREEHEDLQRLLGTRADVRYVPDLPQPITFGAFRPVVLVPDRLRTHPRPIQHAVLCHELFHVQRRDWLWLLAEEVVRAVLWFQPAIWWLVSRVQLAREEAVDELAVLATGGRRTYMQALLAFADEPPLVPAAAFARRHHLFRRLVLISKEAAMSSRRIVLSCAALALVVVAGSAFAVRAFPLAEAAAPQDPSATQQAGPGPVERRANPITPENPVPRRIYSVPAQYPPEALGLDLRAVVTLRVTLDEIGRIVERRAHNVLVQGGDTGMPAMREAFARAAVAAIDQWQYEAPANGPVSFSVALRFAPDAEATLLSHDGSPGTTRTQVLPSELSRIVAPDGAVRVGGVVLQPAKTKDVRPVYPPIARSAQVSGVVVIEALIDPEGRVQEARPLRSIPLLDQAALDAVRQWEFTPTLLNGRPVPVLMTVTVNFTLM